MLTIPRVLLLRVALIAALLPRAATTQPPAREGMHAFTGATIFDGTGARVIFDGVLLVADGRVVAVGSSANVAIPNGAQRVPMDGKFIIPGLISAHSHVNTPADLSTFAAYGVTTVYSLGGESAAVFAERAAQQREIPSRSRVFVAGDVITATTPAEARTAVAALAARRVDMTKIRVDDNLGTTTKMSPEVFRAVIDESHKRRLRLAAHLFYLADAHALLDAGADLIAHSIRDLPVDDALATKLKARNVCVSPTLMREVSTFVYESTPEFFSDPQFLKYANPEWVAQGRDPARQAAMRQSTSAQRYKAGLEVAKRNLKSLFDAGVMIAMGTDTGPAGRFQGYFELMELELMVESGLTPQQTLLTATRDAAKCMRIDRDLGTLEPGRWADFVVLDADPLASISNVRQIRSVWIGGRQISR